METPRHQCLIYAGPATHHLNQIVPEVFDKLKKHYRCLFLGSPSVVARMRFELGAAGVRVDREIQRGSLMFSSERSHLQDGFDVDRMLNLLSESVNQARKDGYRGLWASGDMTWEFGDEQNLAKLLEYECGLEKLFKKLPELSGICQYHLDTLPPHVLYDGLRAHPVLYVNHTLRRFNPYYTPPEILPSRPVPRLSPEEITRLVEEVLQRDKPR